MKKTLVKLLASMVVCVLTARANIVTETSSGEIVLGEWNSNFLKMKEKAETEHIPMVIFWANPGCGYCGILEKACSDKTFKDWQANKKILFCFCRGQTGEAFKCMKFAENSTYLYPYCAFYWKKEDGRTVEKKFTGRTNYMPNKTYVKPRRSGGDYQSEQDEVMHRFMDSIDDFLVGWTDSTSGVSVTLALNDGSGETTSVFATYGKPMPTITPPTRTGYTFGGYWSTLRGGGTKYYNADGTSAANYEDGAERTFWAEWSAKTSEVSLGINDGSKREINIVATYDQPMPEITPPTRQGFVFEGFWTTLQSQGVQYYNADGTSTKNWDKTAESVKLWAKWTSAAAGGDPTAGDPTGGEPTGGEPTGGEPTGGEPTGGDPTGGEPTGGEPTEGEPTGGDPTGGEPTGGDPTEGEPTGGDPTEGEPTGGEPTEGEPTGGEPTEPEPARPRSNTYIRTPFKTYLAVCEETDETKRVVGMITVSATKTMKVTAKYQSCREPRGVSGAAGTWSVSTDGMATASGSLGGKKVTFTLTPDGFISATIVDSRYGAVPMVTESVEIVSAGFSQFAGLYTVAFPAEGLTEPVYAAYGAPNATINMKSAAASKGSAKFKLAFSDVRVTSASAQMTKCGDFGLMPLFKNANKNTLCALLKWEVPTKQKVNVISTPDSVNSSFCHDERKGGFESELACRVYGSYIDSVALRRVRAGSMSFVFDADYYKDGSKIGHPKSISWPGSIKMSSAGLIKDYAMVTFEKEGAKKPLSQVRAKYQAVYIPGWEAELGGLKALGALTFTDVAGAGINVLRGFPMGLK